MMFQLSFNQAKSYAPIFQQGLCVSEENTISHLPLIRSIAQIFRAAKGSGTLLENKQF
jgi:hypothetical protein